MVTIHKSYRTMIQLMLDGHFDLIMLTAFMYLGTKNMDTPHIRAFIKSTLRTPKHRYLFFLQVSQYFRVENMLIYYDSFVGRLSR